MKGLSRKEDILLLFKKKRNIFNNRSTPGQIFNSRTRANLGDRTCPCCSLLHQCLNQRLVIKVFRSSVAAPVPM